MRSRTIAAPQPMHCVVVARLPTMAMPQNASSGGPSRGTAGASGGRIPSINYAPAPWRDRASVALGYSAPATTAERYWGRRAMTQADIAFASERAIIANMLINLLTNVRLTYLPDLEPADAHELL